MRARERGKGGEKGEWKCGRKERGRDEKMREEREKEIGSGCQNILQHIAIVQMQQDVVAAELCFIGTLQTLNIGEGKDRCVCVCVRS